MDHTLQHPDSSAETSPESPLRDSDGHNIYIPENLTLPSIGSSFFSAEDGVSVNSRNHHRCIFAEVENMSSILDSLDRSGRNTIVSSNPSSLVPPPPEASRDVFMLSPHPNLTPEGLRSVTTTHTELYSSEQVFPNTAVDEVPLPLASSQSTGICTLLNKERPNSGSFEDGAFERVADSLLVDSTDDRTKKWHGRLVSESDWDRFRATSKDILPFISEDSESVEPCPLPMPPSPTNVTKSPMESRHDSYRAEDHLPSDFVCGICKDVLVGACILDCNCSSCTVCMNCWEDTDQNQQDFAKRMDFVWVEESKKCPSCHSNAEIKAYCHALDVAILRIIQDLPDSDTSVSSFKQSYFHRLSAWRKTVSDRNERLRKEKMLRDDELLARLIQEEERVFWNEQTRSRSRTKCHHKPSNKFMLFSKAILALIAVVGLKHMSKR